MLFTRYDFVSYPEYLDGGAPRYLGYGFRGAVHVRYALGGDPQAAVTLDVYDNVARDLLGHAFLPGGVLATYAVDGREAELFFSELLDASAAAAAVWGSGTVVAAGRFVAGIHGELPGEERGRLLGRLVSGLLPPGP